MKIEDVFQIISNHYQELLARHRQLTTEIAKLTAAGAINATEYWKDDKYLYLLKPMRKGKREKMYVGNAPYKIRQAREKVQNYHDRRESIKEQEIIERKLSFLDEQAADSLRRIAGACLSASYALKGFNGYKDQLSSTTCCTQTVQDK